jgi:hypothetical protein
MSKDITIKKIWFSNSSPFCAKEDRRHIVVGDVIGCRDCVNNIKTGSNYVLCDASYSLKEEIIMALVDMKNVIRDTPNDFDEPIWPEYNKLVNLIYEYFEENKG